MPTILTGEPKAPGTDRTLDETMLYGREQWQAVWKAWARQWSQPELIKLAEQTLQCRCVHSSQIHGFATGKLRDPAPKLLVAIGQLNLAIARSQGKKVKEKGPKCPGTLKKLWEHADLLTYPTTTANSRITSGDAPDGVMGPVEVFSAVAGLLDLGVDTSREIPVELEQEVAKALGKHLRMAFATGGIDWMDELPELRGMCKSMEPLLMGKKVVGAQLIKDLPAIAEAVATSEEDLWLTAIAPVLNLR
jgi:hypothetical protein